MNFTALTPRSPLTSDITKSTGPVDIAIFLSEDRAQARAVVYAPTQEAANAAAQAMVERAKDQAFCASDVHASPAAESADKPGEWIAYAGWTIGGAS